MKFSVFASITLCLAIFCSPALSDTIYVDGDAPGINNGADWTNAFNELYDALGAAQDGDDILVAEGTYKPDVSGLVNPLEASFAMKNGVVIAGGYAGYGEPNPDARDVELYESILSGDIGVPWNGSDNCYHVFYHPDGLALNGSAVLDGFTITSGNANGTKSDSRRGGGMYNKKGNSPTISNCMFTGNWAYYGAGMNNRDQSNPTLSECTFIDNTANSYGSGMDNYKSSPTVSNCTFRNNTSEFRGGGMFNWRSSPTLSNCIFTDNRANNLGRGGGIENYVHSNPVLINCLFAGNWAGYRGGGMYNGSFSSPTLSNCTFADNETDSDGGGMYNYYNSSPTVTNCIFWGNSSLQIDNYDGTCLPVVNYSCVHGGYAGTGNTSQNPLFADSSVGNFRLWPGSPCIDAGDDDAVPAGVTTDLDGRDRIADGDCDGWAIVDMGAYEFDWAYIGDFSGDCDVDFEDFAIFAATWLREEGEWQFNAACDISIPSDGVIDMADLEVFVKYWLSGV